MAEPFYAVYAVRVLGKREELGLYLAFYALAFTLSNLLWARLAERGSKRVLLAGAFLGLLAPFLAMALPSGPSAWSSSSREPTWPPWASPPPPTSSTWPRPRSGAPPSASPTPSRASSPSPRSSGGTSPTGWAFRPLPPGRPLLCPGPLRGQEASRGGVGYQVEKGVGVRGKPHRPKAWAISGGRGASKSSPMRRRPLKRPNRRFFLAR
jgi:hypothetical protein